MTRPFRVGDVVQPKSGEVVEVFPDAVRVRHTEGKPIGWFDPADLILVMPARIEEPAERGDRVWGRWEEGDEIEPFMRRSDGRWVDEEGNSWPWADLPDPQLERPEDAS